MIIFHSDKGVEMTTYTDLCQAYNDYRKHLSDTSETLQEQAKLLFSSFRDSLKMESKVYLNHETGEEKPYIQLIKRMTKDSTAENTLFGAIPFDPSSESISFAIMLAVEPAPNVNPKLNIYVNILMNLQGRDLIITLQDTKQGDISFSGALNFLNRFDDPVKAIKQNMLSVFKVH